MTAITVANNDSTIMGQIVTALTNATISSVAVFDHVAHVGSRDEWDQKRFHSGSHAGVLYLGNSEYPLSDLRVGVEIECEICLAGRAATEAERKTLITKLANAAKNVLRADAPDTWVAFPVNDELHRRLSFEDIEEGETDTKPWLRAYLPARICYVISARTAH